MNLSFNRTPLHPLCPSVKNKRTISNRRAIRLKETGNKYVPLKSIFND